MNIENIDIKDLVLIGGGFFTLAIIVHGIWLAWRSRQEPLRMDISPDLLPEGDDDLVRFRGELPNGGGRPVKPVQKALDFDETVPVLLDPVGAPAPAAAAPAAASSRCSEAEAADTPEPGAREDELSPIRAGVSDPVLPDTGPIVAEDPRRSRPGDRRESERSMETNHAPPDAGGRELLVINLFAADGEHFTGEALLAAMRAQGLKFGQMNIFHRLDPATRETRFSVANVLEPGYFDLADISSLASPGLVFFLQLPGPDSPGEAVEDMIRITRAIADELGAVLKDENMSMFTPQTAEHYRERVADFSRRRLSRRVGVA